MNIQIIDINKLIPATYNPRKDLKPDDAEYIKIKNSIVKFGFVSPLVINKDMTVIGGHQRLKVLKDLGITEVECIVVDLDKTNEKALNIALNKILMKELEKIAEELEKGNLSLDESVSKFEDGMKLSKKCSDLLDTAEKKITMLINDNGTIKEENFNVANIEE